MFDNSKLCWQIVFCQNNNFALFRKAPEFLSTQCLRQFVDALKFIAYGLQGEAVPGTP